MIFFVVYMSSKRPLGPPSGTTPDKPPQKSKRSQRRETTSRKSLLFNQDVTTKTVFTVFFENLSRKQGISKYLLITWLCRILPYKVSPLFIYA